MNWKTIGQLLLISAAKSFAATGVAVLEEKAGKAENVWAKTGWGTAAGTVTTVAPILDELGSLLLKKAAGETAPVTQ